MACATGHGATIVFKTSTAFVPDVRSMEGWSKSRPVLDTSTLLTELVRTNCGGDLYDVSSFDLDILYEPGAAKNDYEAVLYDGNVARQEEDIDVVFANGQKESLKGYVTNFTRQQVATDVLMAATITVQPSGKISTLAA